MLGTIMAANVFFVIIPAHRKLVAAMEEKTRAGPRAAARGEEPVGAQQLPHAAGAVHHARRPLRLRVRCRQAWLVFVAIALLTALIRVFFNRWHTGRRVWWIPVVATAGVVALALWLRPEETGTSVIVPVTFAQIQPVIAERCAPCHSGASAPLGIRFETQEQIEARIDDIERQAVQTRAMPPGNATGMTEAERELLGAWIAQR